MEKISVNDGHKNVTIINYGKVNQNGNQYQEKFDSFSGMFKALGYFIGPELINILGMGDHSKDDNSTERVFKELEDDTEHVENEVTFDTENVDARYGYLDKLARNPNNDDCDCEIEYDGEKYDLVTKERLSYRIIKEHDKLYKVIENEWNKLEDKKAKIFVKYNDIKDIINVDEELDFNQSIACEGSTTLFNVWNTRNFNDGVRYCIFEADI